MASTSLLLEACSVCIVLTLRRVKELVPAQPVEEEPQERVRIIRSTALRTRCVSSKSCARYSGDPMKWDALLTGRRCTVSRSPRPTVTPRSRVPTLSSEGTTGMLCTAPCALWCAPPSKWNSGRDTDYRCRRRSRRASATRHKERTMTGDEDGFPFTMNIWLASMA